MPGALADTPQAQQRFLEALLSALLVGRLRPLLLADRPHDVSQPLHEATLASERACTRSCSRQAGGRQTSAGVVEGEGISESPAHVRKRRVTVEPLWPFWPIAAPGGPLRGVRARVGAVRWRASPESAIPSPQLQLASRRSAMCARVAPPQAAVATAAAVASVVSWAGRPPPAAGVAALGPRRLRPLGAELGARPGVRGCYHAIGGGARAHAGAAGRRGTCPALVPPALPPPFPLGTPPPPLPPWRYGGWCGGSGAVLGDRPRHRHGAPGEVGVGFLEEARGRSALRCPKRAESAST